MVDKSDRFDILENRDGVSIVFSSTLQNVDRACEAICLNLKTALEGVSKHLFSIQLVLREGLTNAVRHGNGMDRSKHVCCSVKLRDSRTLYFEIEDEGDGFDWQRQKERKPHDDGEHGRGLVIMGQYVSDFWYNEVGNKLVLVKKVH